MGQVLFGRRNHVSFAKYRFPKSNYTQECFRRQRLHVQIATIAVLATLGNSQPQLKFHIKGALNIGLSKDEIKEIMLLMTVYAGFPAAINGTNILKEVMMESNYLN
ncbi:carboxymuconolactone decarboxylase family protein [Parabacteroides sp. 52]|nr:alkylhydroperoxidase/carboxymuconolactone decarboxylase family protein YurZ [Parabacteroides sp. PM5-20]NDV54584.1 carboxymuconolactone decarboxylase family protein [Parabacteroides sp. 52]